MMTYSGSHSRKRLFCLLIVLASSVMCYVVVTSPNVPVLSSAYQRHAYNGNVNFLMGRAMDQNVTTGEKAEQINCSCDREMLFVLSDTIDDYNDVEQNLTSNNRTTSTKATKSHRLIPKNGKTVMINSLTGNLWNFKEMGDQQLYLYENLLRQKWSSNLTKADILRQELAKYRSELEGNSQILLHQKNIKVGEAVKFVFGSKVKAMSSDVFRYLPKRNPFPEGSRYRSCAVVGNSGIILNSSCGEEIDKHEFVFRCNLAPMSPFKEDAGIKSNFTTMNPSLLFRNYQYLRTPESTKKYNEDISKYDGVLWLPCYSFSSQFPTALRAITKYSGQKPKMVCGNPMHFKSVVSFWSEREQNQRISSGFYLVTTALQLCDEVQLYGFWPFSERYGDSKMNVPYHYFDDMSAKEAKRVHSMDKEFSLLVQLHTLGILRINLGPCI